ncbi:MAG: hypothetical protein KAQ65_00050, partial [Candidatus Thorarchaeota archaeon]|nr:hypothetical protein [Candidatus Thorarchaeota archaeon]
MSEHKSVIVDLEETEKTNINEFGEQASAEAAGVVSVNNVSERCRIWNVKVLVPEGRKGTNIEEKALSAGEVDAGGKWETGYSIAVDAPIVTFTEVYDTNGDMETEEAHWAYVMNKDNPVKITLTIKNETAGQLDNIILNKTIPPELTNIIIESAKSGTAEFDEGTRQVVWKDLVIYPNEDSVLVIKANGRADSTEVANAGEIVITYRGEDQQRSSLKPDMSALTEYLTGIETAETEPNEWECILECSNESDIMVRLDKAEVYLIPEDGGEKEKKIEESPRFEMIPSQEWSAKFEVSSKSPPKCTQEVTYTPMNTVTRRVLGTINKVAQPIPVAHVEYTKEFDPPEVNSFDKTPVEINIELKNAGTAKFNDIKIVDNLPDDVMPPKTEHISALIRGEEFTGDFEVVVDPDDQNPEVPHTITFHLKNLKDSVGELEPGDSVKINYAIMAWRNRPEKEYPSPIQCYANTYPEGITADSISESDTHKIGIMYKKRRISAKKAINKGSGAGEYSILLVVENKGEVTVENVKVIDWIPAGFSYIIT